MEEVVGSIPTGSTTSVHLASNIFTFVQYSAHRTGVTRLGLTRRM
jgi:hypothetical protein